MSKSRQKSTTIDGERTCYAETAQHPDPSYLDLLSPETRRRYREYCARTGTLYLVLDLDPEQEPQPGDREVFGDLHSDTDVRMGRD